MANIEVVCPFCQRVQNVPEKRLQDKWVCLHCRGTIDDPFLHKKKSKIPQLAIPLHGKIISASGITNLSEIIATSEEYSKGFDESVYMPNGFDLGAYTQPEPQRPLKRERSYAWVWFVLFAGVVLGALAVYLYLVVMPGL